MSLSRRIAKFIAELTPATIPAAVLDEARLCLIDWIGVTIAGSVEHAVMIARDVVLACRGPAQSSLIGSGERASVTQAAFVNGVAGHVLDFDDMSPIYIGHNTSIFAPVALATGEFVNANGADILTGLVAGWEVSCALGHNTIPHHYERGWHATGTIGLLGATATAAKLLSLSVDQTMHALGIAASAASGLRANVASMTNLYHVGHAAEQGILAALLARRGWTSSENSLEGPNGFFQVLAGGHSAEASVDQLGRAWAMLTPGVSRKRYPTCGAMHPTFDAVLDIVRSENIRSEDVESIHCKTTPAVIQLLTCVRPTTQVEARFSLPFAAAIALLDRCVGPEQVTDEKVRDPRIRELMKRVVIEVDPEYIGRFDADFTTTVTLSLRDSRKLQRRVEAPRGPMTTTMTQEDVNEKFRLCAAQRLDPLNTARVLDVLKHFEEEKDIRGLMRMIS